MFNIQLRSRTSDMYARARHLVTYSMPELRTMVLAELDHEWITTTELVKWLGLGGVDHYRLALALERLANDGLAELQRPGSHVRRFRRRPR